MPIHGRDTLAKGWSKVASLDVMGLCCQPTPAVDVGLS